MSIKRLNRLKSTSASAAFLFLFFTLIFGRDLYSNNSFNFLQDSQNVSSYIEIFTRFIDWPDTDPFTGSGCFTIGVYGDGPIFSDMQNEYGNKTIKGNDVQVKLIKNLAEAEECNLVYINKITKKNLAKLIKRVKDMPILTVSKKAGFAELGVHINLIDSSDKLEYEINDQAVRASGLKMSYLLLLQARLVKTRADKE